MSTTGFLGELLIIQIIDVRSILCWQIKMSMRSNKNDKQMCLILETSKMCTTGGPSETGLRTTGFYRNVDPETYFVINSVFVCGLTFSTIFLSVLMFLIHQPTPTALSSDHCGSPLCMAGIMFSISSSASEWNAHAKWQVDTPGHTNTV